MEEVANASNHTIHEIDHYDTLKNYLQHGLTSDDRQRLTEDVFMKYALNKLEVAIKTIKQDPHWHRVSHAISVKRKLPSRAYGEMNVARSTVLNTMSIGKKYQLHKLQLEWPPLKTINETKEEVIKLYPAFKTLYEIEKIEDTIRFT